MILITIIINMHWI